MRARYPTRARARRAGHPTGVLLRELPSALLVVLACAQIALAFAAGLSPWKGGGFGMFATTDHGGFRRVRAYAIGAEGERPLALPPELQRDALRAATWPAQCALRRVAEGLAESGAAAAAEAVRVEVWRTRFDDALRPTQERIAAVTAGAPS